MGEADTVSEPASNGNKQNCIPVYEVGYFRRKCSWGTRPSIVTMCSPSCICSISDSILSWFSPASHFVNRSKIYTTVSKEANLRGAENAAEHFGKNRGSGQIEQTCRL